jgi:hypothetical protein
MSIYEHRTYAWVLLAPFAMFAVLAFFGHRIGKPALRLGARCSVVLVSLGFRSS